MSLKRNKLIDSHCHVNSFDDNFHLYFENVIGMEIFEYSDNIKIALMEQMSKSGLWVAAGLHPLSASYDKKFSVKQFLENNIHLLSAIGETGIDLLKLITMKSKWTYLLCTVK